MHYTHVPLIVAEWDMDDLERRICHRAGYAALFLHASRRRPHAPGYKNRERRTRFVL